MRAYLGGDMTCRKSKLRTEAATTHFTNRWPCGGDLRLLTQSSPLGTGSQRATRLALGQLSVQFRWLVVLAVSSERCLDARLQARKAGVGLRSKIRKHLAVASFDRGENFIDAGKHAPDNLDHLAPQNVEFAAQPLDVALAL